MFYSVSEIVQHAVETRDKTLEAHNKGTEVRDRETIPSPSERVRVRSLLIQACHAGLRDSSQAYGNVFSQVDFLCKRHGIKPADRADIQTMRHNSNGNSTQTYEDFMYDVRALCIFISAVFNTGIPDRLTRVIPHTCRPAGNIHKIDTRYARGIVQSWNTHYIYMCIEHGTDSNSIAVDFSAEEFSYLKDILREGMQLNILDSSIGDSTDDMGKEGVTTVMVPRLIVVEPDFLIDISSIAACFKEYGHHPLTYTVNRMQPRANSYATLLGNFAGDALDDIVNRQTKYSPAETLRNNFTDKALEFCSCRDFNGSRFKHDAAIQTENIRQAADVLFRQAGMTQERGDNPRYERGKTIIEPSFVCERLGIQGRVDLMTSDFRLLVEQKSGRNMSIERRRPNEYGSFQQESHYVQLLLYYGVLRYNFSLGSNVDIRLLYSKYPPSEGLVVVAFYRKLLNEAIHLRNLIVAQELDFARYGFGKIIDSITPETLNVRNAADSFYHQFLYPQTERITAPLHRLSPLEKAYYCRMMTFVYREQRVGKLGAQEGVTSCSADLWNMPLAEKIETGNIYTGLTITQKERSRDNNGFDLITLAVPEQGYDFLPNFRCGDMVYLYSYDENREPDARNSILFKGSLKEIRSSRLTVALTDGQQNQEILGISGDNGTDGQTRVSGRHSGTRKRYAVEHAGSDSSAGAAIRGLHQFISTTPDRKALLLGQRTPRKDESLTLSRSYNPDYDGILLRAKQARDYFLLTGPPGTGKTSMALRYLVTEELASGGNSADILLTAYTNRAVDEICGMLAGAGLGFLRLGNKYNCAPQFRNRLLDNVAHDCPRLDTIRQRIADTRIITGTTSMLQAKPFIFDMKTFSLAIIDEASQILEPDIIGLLSLCRDGGRENVIKRFILIGDHKQLPAVVQQSAKDSAVSEPLLREIGVTDCRNSLFERLIHTEYAAGRNDFTGTLRKQGRMHPDIAWFPNSMFYIRERLKPVPLPHQKEAAPDYNTQSEDSTDDILKSRRMVFIPSRFCRQPSLSDKVNTDEAVIVCDMLRRIRRFYGERFNAEKTVGVIVPYRNQIAVIRKEMERRGLSGMDEVSIDTVERYQGSQRDVIIYSFTIQNRYQLEFLTDNCIEEDGHTIDRKLNVAITRARKQMIITGNPRILGMNGIFARLMEHIKEKGGWIMEGDRKR